MIMKISHIEKIVLVLIVLFIIALGFLVKGCSVLTSRIDQKGLKDITEQIWYGKNGKKQ